MKPSTVGGQSATFKILTCFTWRDSNIARVIINCLDVEGDLARLFKKHEEVLYSLDGLVEERLSLTGISASDLV